MLHNIQALRGLAAILVVFHHAAPHYKAMGGDNSLYLSIASHGYTGVDIFFIISGYVMALTTVRKSRNLRHAFGFLQKRLLRIYLGYWPFFLLALLVAINFLPQKLDRLDLSSSFFLTSPDMFVLLLPVSWSLTYELLFYSLIFLLFALPLMQANRVLGGIFLCLLTINIFFPVTNHPVSKFFLSPYIMEFIAGYYLYLLLRKERSIFWGIGFLLLLIGGYSLGSEINAKYDFNRVYSFGVGAFGLVALAIWTEQRNWINSGPLLSKFGDASYVIYLCHLPFLTLFYFLGIRSWLSNQNTVLMELGFYLYLLLILLFSLAFHYKIEHPLYKSALSRLHIRPSSKTYP